MHTYWRLVAKISPVFRRKRMRRFRETFRPTAPTRILDIGGLPRFWQEVDLDAQITLLNLEPLDEYEGSFLGPNQRFMVGDGTSLSFQDGEFDIVFSNSVIEHLGTADAQAAFARECRRVGKSYWVQTPAKEFPAEPHYTTLFLHWCAKPVQARLLPYFSLWGLLRRPDRGMIKMALAELRLLRRREFRDLFPDGEVWTERVLGLPKSYTAVRIG